MHFIKLILFAIVFEVLACFGIKIIEGPAYRAQQFTPQTSAGIYNATIIPEDLHIIPYSDQALRIIKYPGSAMHTTGIEDTGKGFYASLRPYLSKPSFTY